MHLARYLAQFSIQVNYKSANIYWEPISTLSSGKKALGEAFAQQETAWHGCHGRKRTQCSSHQLGRLAINH